MPYSQVKTGRSYLKNWSKSKKHLEIRLIPANYFFSSLATFHVSQVRWPENPPENRQVEPKAAPNTRCNAIDQAAKYAYQAVCFNVCRIEVTFHSLRPLLQGSHTESCSLF